MLQRTIEKSISVLRIMLIKKIHMAGRHALNALGRAWYGLALPWMLQLWNNSIIVDELSNIINYLANVIRSRLLSTLGI